MDDIPLSVLVTILVISVIGSAFASASETGLMTLNRYRLRHLVNEGHGGAIRASRLLERPDRLIGLILLLSNFFNSLASSVSAIIALRLGGDTGFAIGTGLVTLVLLIFGEVAPKTLAALKPERVAFPVAYFYIPAAKLAYPLVWAVNVAANGLLRLFGVRADQVSGQALSREELRSVVNEAGALIPQRHQQMLLGILDLEKVAVDDIMIPRNEIMGIDIDDNWNQIRDQLMHSQHTRLLVYKGDVDHVIGVVHIRHVLHLLTQKNFTRERLLEVVREPYYVLEATTLTAQLMSFQRLERRVGLVVNEYGDLLGLVTLEDILEEIVGEFTSDPTTSSRNIHRQEDGSILADASIYIRQINRTARLNLPTSGPKTLNGLITEYLEAIPEPGTTVKIEGYPIEVVQTVDNAIKTVRIYPKITSNPA